MPISKERLQSILSGRAAELCSPNNSRKLDEIVRNREITEYGPVEDFDDSMFLSETYEDKEDSPIREQNYSAENSRMPDAIKMSMINNPIDVSSVDVNRSVLDTMNIPSVKKTRPAVSRSVNENVSYSGVQSVDYSLIKTIIEECVDRKMKELKEQIINENRSIQTIGFKKGEIVIVDNGGNIYSANLKKRGNTNDEVI